MHGAMNVKKRTQIAQVIYIIFMSYNTNIFYPDDDLLRSTHFATIKYTYAYLCRLLFTPLLENFWNLYRYQVENIYEAQHCWGLIISIRLQLLNDFNHNYEFASILGSVFYSFKQHMF
jgi:hypothetical protein